MDWKETKKIIAKRDNYKCVVCGDKALGSQIHHLIHRKDGGNNEHSNLVNLCGKCHMLESDTPDFAVKKAFKIPLFKIPMMRKEIREKLEIIKNSKKNINNQF